MNIYQLSCSHTFSYLKGDILLRGSKMLVLKQNKPLLQQNLEQVPSLHQLSNPFLDLSFKQSRRSRCSMTRGLTRLLHNFSNWKNLCIASLSCSNVTLHLHNRMFQRDHLLQQNNHRHHQMLLFNIFRVNHFTIQERENDIIFVISFSNLRFSLLK